MGRWSKRVLAVVGPELVYAYLLLLRLTCRIRFENHRVFGSIRDEPGAYILAFWHSRFLLMPYCYREGAISVLLSQHRDARMLARIMARFRIGVLYGSSTRGGVTGMRAMLREARARRSVGIAPDGPRGPRRRAKPGVIAAARLTGLPIVPVAFAADRARRLGSWDRSLVPKLFSRGLFLYGEPIRVPHEADADEQERLRSRLEQVLDRITDEADRRMGYPVEEPRPVADPA